MTVRARGSGGRVSGQARGECLRELLGRRPLIVRDTHRTQQECLRRARLRRTRDGGTLGELAQRVSGQRHRDGCVDERAELERGQRRGLGATAARIVVSGK